MSALEPGERHGSTALAAMARRWPNPMTVEIIFEFHSTSLDNETRVASGWSDPPLSEAGRERAKELGERWRGECIDAVFCSDLRRAVETAEIAFPGIPVHPDRRLREYDYGAMTRSPVEQIPAERAVRVDIPFPEGGSLRDVATRVGEFLDGLASDWDSKRVLLIGHAATKLALDHLLGGMTLEVAVGQAFIWRAVPPSYRYALAAE